MVFLIAQMDWTSWCHRIDGCGCDRGGDGSTLKGAGDGLQSILILVAHGSVHLLGHLLCPPLHPLRRYVRGRNQRWNVE